MRQLTSSFGKRLWAALFFFALSGQAAMAQGLGELTTVRAQSPVDCLVVKEGKGEKPIYPPDELHMKSYAKVHVQLSFEGPDAPPHVKIVENSNASEFADSVKDFVAHYRLPCMQTGAAPILVNQEFSFNPTDGRKVFYGPAEDADAVSMERSCIAMGGSKVPDIPRSVLQSGKGGNVVANVTFERQNAEPKVQIIFDGKSRPLAQSVRNHMEQYRYTCVVPEGRPLTASQVFAFRVDGSTRYAFQDVALQDFLGMVEPEGLRNAKFDLTKMGCPFDVSIMVLKPYAKNNVGEIGSADGSRKPFIDWLESLTMMLPQSAEAYLIGQYLRVSVPCIVLDLK